MVPMHLDLTNGLFVPHNPILVRVLFFYRGADKSLARPGRKQANVSVRMA